VVVGRRQPAPARNDEPEDSLAQETPHIPRALGLPVFGGSKVLFAAAHAQHAAVVTAAGELWAWGQGNSGCLGLGQLIDSQDVIRVPTRVGEAAGAAFGGAAVLMAACGCRHTVVLTDSGAVWTCGSGLCGVIGHGDVLRHYVPTRIPQDQFEDSRILCVAAAGHISMALTAAGALYSWGIGPLGLGYPDMLTEVRTPTAVAATLPPGARVGRTCAAPRGHMLAFSMGAHARLGAHGCAHASASDDALRNIFAAGSWLSGAYAHMGEGLLRLLAVRLRTAG